MTCFLIIRFFQTAADLSIVDSFILLSFGTTFGCIITFICYICSVIVYNNVLLFKEFVKFNYLISKISKQNVSDLLLVNKT